MKWQLIQADSQEAHTGKKYINTIYKKYWHVSVNKKRKYAGCIIFVDFYDAIMELLVTVLFEIWLVNTINIAADIVTDLKIKIKTIYKRDQFSICFLTVWGK